MGQTSFMTGSLDVPQSDPRGVRVETSRKDTPPKTPYRGLYKSRVWGRGLRLHDDLSLPLKDGHSLKHRGVERVG